MQEVSNTKGCLFALVVGVVTFGGLFTLMNFGNHSVDGGYVGYVYSNPIMSQKEFKNIINGPGGTGFWAWRQELLPISVTPWTVEEKFDDILAKDKLMMNAQASLVFRINKARVKEFVEDYGAMSEVDRKPESIIMDAYNSFIKQHFRSAIRAEVSRYNGLDASANIPAITNAVELQLKARFEGTPFIVESVTIGSTTPPKSVTEGVTKKVEATQAYERQTIERDMARQQEEIQEAQGRAAARKAEQEAEGQRLAAKAKADAELYSAQREAEAQLFARQKEAEGVLVLARAQAEGKKAEAEALTLYSKAIGDNYVALEFVKNLDRLHLPQTIVGSDFMQQIGGMFKGVTIDGSKAVNAVLPTPQN